MLLNRAPALLRGQNEWPRPLNLCRILELLPVRPATRGTDSSVLHHWFLHEVLHGDICFEMEINALVLLGGAATCSKRFVICFLKVPLACLGGMAAAVQPNSLGNSQKTVNKTFGTSCLPNQYMLT